MLGANRITSLSDDTREAKAANAVYDQSLRSILSETCWSFATKRALLNRLEEVPVVGSGYYFQRPSDCIEIFETTANSWRPEGEKIWSLDPTLGVIYTYLNDDDTFYSELISYNNPPAPDKHLQNIHESIVKYPL